MVGTGNTSLVRSCAGEDGLLIFPPLEKSWGGGTGSPAGPEMPCSGSSSCSGTFSRFLVVQASVGRRGLMETPKQGRAQM